jgi:hypothetical protein
MDSRPVDLPHNLDIIAGIFHDPQVLQSNCLRDDLSVINPVTESVLMTNLLHRARETCCAKSFWYRNQSYGFVRIEYPWSDCANPEDYSCESSHSIVSLARSNYPNPYPKLKWFKKSLNLAFSCRSIPVISTYSCNCSSIYWTFNYKQEQRSEWEISCRQNRISIRLTWRPPQNLS